MKNFETKKIPEARADLGQGRKPNSVRVGKDECSANLIADEKEQKASAAAEVMPLSRTPS